MGAKKSIYKISKPSFLDSAFINAIVKTFIGSSTDPRKLRKFFELEAMLSGPELVL